MNLFRISVWNRVLTFSCISIRVLVTLRFALCRYDSFENPAAMIDERKKRARKNCRRPNCFFPCVCKFNVGIKHKINLWQTTHKTMCHTTLNTKQCSMVRLLQFLVAISCFLFVRWILCKSFVTCSCYFYHNYDNTYASFLIQHPANTWSSKF